MGCGQYAAFEDTDNNSVSQNKNGAEAPSMSGSKPDNYSQAVATVVLTVTVGGTEALAGSLYFT
jgi:hypothetical protein